MRKILVVAALFLGALSGQAQEKVMKVIKKDGSSAQTRVVDLKQISFLTVAEGGQGLLIKTVGGETAAVLFEAHPIVTVSDSKLSSNPIRQKPWNLRFQTSRKYSSAMHPMKPQPSMCLKALPMYCRTAGRCCGASPKA